MDEPVHSQTFQDTFPLAAFWFVIKWAFFAWVGVVVGGIAGAVTVAASFGVARLLMSGPLHSVTAGILIGVPAPLLVFGSVTGLVAGNLQANLLSWPPSARRRWRIASAICWLVAPLVGAVLVVLVHMTQQELFHTDPLSIVSLLLWFTCTVGVVAGLGLRLALPSPAPHLAVWVGAHVLATSLGWMLAYLLTSVVMTGSMLVVALVLGPTVYGLVTGTTMHWVEEQRLSQADHDA